MGMFWEDEAWREGTQQFFHVKTIMGISNIEWWEKKSSIFFIFLWTFCAHRKRDDRVLPRADRSRSDNL